MNFDSENYLLDVIAVFISLLAKSYGAINSKIAMKES
jgi:hypothetical protein